MRARSDRRLVPLLGAALFAVTAAGWLLACASDGVDEAVEEVHDEIDDAADEIGDEIDDHT